MTRGVPCCPVLSHVQLFAASWIAGCQASLSFTISQSLLKLRSTESVMPYSHLIFCHPFSCPQYLPAWGSFPVSQLFTSGGRSTGASAEVAVFLEFLCPFYDLTNVCNLTSGSSAFSKTSLYIWNFSIHVLLKPSLKDFEHYLASKCWL